ncbi:DNA polymerase III subunit gamma and tau, partial [Streptomyces sp. MBT72]|nr:DNA polymerase III subunit gamma and tau [Streptomyces sp. MBT72]
SGEQAPAAAPAAPAAPEGGQNMAQGVAQVRNMWPDILEAVKNRRRFTWILLSQNAQVAGFDGTTLQLGFLNAGARDNFASSGSEEVLKQALAERFNAQWRIEAVIDPSGGGGTSATATGLRGRPAATGGV